jgi:hypothetical protein
MIACMLFDSCWGKNHSSFVNDYGLLSEKIQKTRAWAAIQATNAEISHHARIYAHNHQAMIGLGINPMEIETSYRQLLPSDLVTSTAIMQPNLPGQSQQRLSWIWTYHLPSSASENHLSECKFIRVCSRLIVLSLPLQFTECIG